MLGIKRLAIIDSNNVLTLDDSYRADDGIAFLLYEYWVHNSSKDIFIKVGRGITACDYIDGNYQKALERAIFSPDWKRIINRAYNPSETSFRGRIFC